MLYRLLTAACAVMLPALLAATPAAAKNCYEDIGCPHERFLTRSELVTHGCDGLSHFRNSIFQANRYCFKTPVMISRYGNQGCRHHDQNAVPLNAYERANVLLIRQVERQKGCR